jgi:hypothetical protein
MSEAVCDESLERMRTAYLETSIIGYVASRPSRDLVTAGNQQLTRDWWDNCRQQYEIYVSEAVLAECSEGDPIAVQERNGGVTSCGEIRLLNKCGNSANNTPHDSITI